MLSTLRYNYMLLVTETSRTCKLAGLKVTKLCGIELEEVDLALLYILCSKEEGAIEEYCYNYELYSRRDDEI